MSGRSPGRATHDLRGRTALVTGGGRGLGRSIAQGLASAGALVAIADAQSADATVAAIGDAGGQAFALQARLGTRRESDRLAGALAGELAARTGQEGLDILINNIGGGDYLPFAAIDAERLEHYWDLNVRVPFFLTQALLGRINDDGRIINISSVGSTVTTPDIIPYSMCKAAIDIFTVGIAKIVGARGITVNSINPGLMNVETNFDFLQDASLRDMSIASTLLGRIGQPADVSDFVVALAMPAGRWVTGQNIKVSGGAGIG